MNLNKDMRGHNKIKREIVKVGSRLKDPKMQFDIQGSSDVSRVVVSLIS